jgi:hypothetical protein
MNPRVGGERLGFFQLGEGFEPRAHAASKFASNKIENCT